MRLTVRTSPSFATRLVVLPWLWLALACGGGGGDDGGDDDGDDAAASEQVLSQQQPAGQQPASGQQQPVMDPLPVEETPDDRGAQEQTSPTPTPSPTPSPEPTPSPDPEPDPLQADLVSDAPSQQLLFPTQLATLSRSALLTITNLGDDAADSLIFTLGGSDFVYTGGSFPGTAGDCGTELAVSASCSLDLSVSLPAAGLAAETLTVAWQDDVGGGDATINLNFTAVATASFTLNGGAAQDFPATAPNTTDDALLTIANNGGWSASTVALGMALSSQFYFPAGFPGSLGDCGSELAAGSQCTLHLRFAPDAAATFNDRLEIDYFDGLANQTVGIDLSGDGAAVAQLQLSGGGVHDFGVVEINATDSYHMIVTNIGQTTATTMAGVAPAAPFEFAGGAYPGTGGTCTTDLNAGADCTIALAYAPTAAGSFNETFSLTYNNGSDDVNVAGAVTGAASDVFAPDATVTTALDTVVTISLTATGGTAPAPEIVIDPDHGSLTSLGGGQWDYTPDSGFTGLDTFTWLARDGAAVSNTAEVRVFVQPEALFVVANAGSLNAMDQSYNDRLVAAGFAVSTVSAAAATLGDADGKDIVAVSESVNSSDVGTLYRDIAVPFVTWERYLWDDMGMSVDQTENGLVNTTDIEIIDDTHPLAGGLGNGVHTVLGVAGQIPYLLTTNDNIQRIATIAGDPTQTVMFAYESQVEMTGSLIAPARRIGMFFPNGGGNVDAVGTGLVDTSIHYLMSGVTSLMRDHMQRADAADLGASWSQTDDAQQSFGISGARLVLDVAGNAGAASIRRSFTPVTTGIVTLTFELAMNTDGSDADYGLAVQLGQGEFMVAGDEHSGVAAQLVWSGVNAGMTGEGWCGHGNSVGNTPVAAANSGMTLVSLSMNLDTDTFSLTCGGTTVTGVAAANSLAKVDTIRINADSIDSTAMTSQYLDNIRIFLGQ